MRATLVALGALLFAGAAGAVEDPYGNWFKHFYQTRDIGQFDGFWKKVTSDKMLENKGTAPPIMGFASQVLHQYPALIQGRLDDPSAFPKEYRESILTLLWLSNTEEARQILERDGDGSLARRPPPSIATQEIASAGDLDFCWGWYFATGDTAALDPIISALDFGQYAGALKKYRASPKTAADREAAVKDAIFGAAMWSLGANAGEDPRIAHHIRVRFFDAQTPESRKVWLAPIFTRVSSSVSKQELEDSKAGR